LPAGPLLLTGYDSMISRMPQARSAALHSQSSKNQHVTGLNPLTTFRARRQNGFANVVLIGSDRAAVLQPHPLPKRPNQIGAEARTGQSEKVSNII